jgi:hypothetical protein
VLVATEGEAFDLDLLAASLRADSSDAGAFVEGLAGKLEAVLPGRVSVQRKRRGMLGPKVVRRIAVEGGDVRLELLRSESDAIDCRLGRVSGGILLKSQTVDVDAWLAALGEALAVEAGRNQRTRQALERLLIDGGA